MSMCFVFFEVPSLEAIDLPDDESANAVWFIVVNNSVSLRSDLKPCLVEPTYVSQNFKEGLVVENSCI